MIHLHLHVYTPGIWNIITSASSQIATERQSFILRTTDGFLLSITSDDLQIWTSEPCMPQIASDFNFNPLVNWTRSDSNPAGFGFNTILFKIITRIKLRFSNYLGRYSYSFRARQELISVTVTVFWVWREYVFTVTVRYNYIKNGLRNYFPKISVTVT